MNFWSNVRNTWEWNGNGDLKLGCIFLAISPGLYFQDFYIQHTYIQNCRYKWQWLLFSSEEACITLNKTQTVLCGDDCLPCFEVLPPAPPPAAVSHPVFYCNHTQKKTAMKFNALNAFSLQMLYYGNAFTWGGEGVSKSETA